jgi:hypothetical protein
MKILLLLSTCLVTGHFFSQYCTTAGPTTTADSNIESVQITGTSGSINYVGCPGVLGVENLSSTQSTTLSAGLNYNLTVKFGTCGGNFSGAGEAWIDFNTDGVYAPTESIGTWVGIPPAAPQIFNFTVPIGAQTGTTRLRVMQREQGILPLDPCASYLWGSVVEFGIVIVGGVDCSSYLGDLKETAIPINSLPYATTGNTSYCYFNQNLVYNSPDIYYRLIPLAPLAVVNVSLCGSLFDTFLSVIDPQGNVIAYNDDGACDSTSSLSFSTVGIDTAYLIIEGWGAEMGAFTLTVNGSNLGISENDAQIIKAYPNPTSGIVSFPGVENSNLKVCDIKGNVLENIASYNGGEIDVTRYSNGIYFISIEQNGKIYTSKISLVK